ncbi:MAG: hypothetical protein JW704_13175 [Anaerolineaceae bacterium]|nr:hypothetical protein [Anaerolineaceae bacterium]
MEDALLAIKTELEELLAAKHWGTITLSLDVEDGQPKAIHVIYVKDINHHSIARMKGAAP